MIWVLKRGPVCTVEAWCLFRISLGAWSSLHKSLVSLLAWEGPHRRGWWRVVKTTGQGWSSPQTPYQRGQLYSLDPRYTKLMGTKQAFWGVRIRYIQSNNRIRAKGGGSNKKFFVFCFFFSPTDLSWFLDWPFRRQIVWLNKPACWSLGVYFCPQNYQLVYIIQFLGRIMLL